MRKPWQQSVTVWVNAIVGTLTTLLEVTNQAAPFMSDALHVKILAGVGIATTIANLLLRILKTNTAILAPTNPPA